MNRLSFNTRSLLLVILGVGAGAFVVSNTLTVLSAEPDAAQARGPGSDVARTSDGRVLHRRLPDSDNVGGEFIYDPQALDTTLPSELIRDGNPHPRPPLAPEPRQDEAVLTHRGFVSPEEAEGEGESDGLAESVGEAIPGAEADKPGAPPTSANGGGSENPGLPTDEGDNPSEPDAPKSPSGPSTGLDPRMFNGDTAEPDRDTNREDRLDYHAVFDPSLVPFKRNRALGTVTPSFGVVLRRGHVSEVKAQGIRSEVGRESFWGSILIDTEADTPIPLPSVAPSSRILRAEVVPPVDVRFFRDEADNFYVQTAKSGRYRLVFVMDAPTGYFGRPLPAASVKLRDVPRSRTPQLPPKVRRDGLRFAAELGLRPSGGFSATLSKLVNHFRSFVPGEPPASTGNIYLDLARGQRGICRHRSFGFVVTAQALGIPARYVFNEAHVFVEVYVPGPDAGWLRIDLGGGANDLHIHSAADKLQHKPRGRDPFASPDPFAQATTQGNLAGAMTVHGAPPQARPQGNLGSDPEGAAVVADAAALSVPTPRQRAGATPSTTHLTLGRGVAFRGDSLIARGHVVDAGGSAATQGTVQLVLAAPIEADSSGVNELRPIRLLATANVTEDGTFEIRFTMPLDQAPGNYEVRAQFMGNGTLNPSTSP